MWKLPNGWTIEREEYKKKKDPFWFSRYVVRHSAGGVVCEARTLSEARRKALANHLGEAFPGTPLMNGPVEGYVLRGNTALLSAWVERLAELEHPNAVPILETLTRWHS